MTVKKSAKVVSLDKYRKRGVKAALVPGHVIDPKRGLMAEQYLDPDGRSRVYQEINVLNWAKAWKRRMLRYIKDKGFTTIEEYFKCMVPEGGSLPNTEKNLFKAVETLEKWEKSQRS